MPTPTDAELVAALLDAVSPLSSRQASRAVGISPVTVQRFRSGDWKGMQGRTRLAVLRYLERAGKMPPGGAPPAPLSDAERARALELLRELEALLRGT